MCTGACVAAVRNVQIAADKHLSIVAKAFRIRFECAKVLYQTNKQNIGKRAYGDKRRRARFDLLFDDRRRPKASDGMSSVWSFGQYNDSALQALECGFERLFESNGRTLWRERQRNEIRIHKFVITNDENERWKTRTSS
jgi:hypothetical protein